MLVLGFRWIAVNPRPDTDCPLNLSYGFGRLQDPFGHRLFGETVCDSWQKWICFFLVIMKDKQQIVK